MTQDKVEIKRISADQLTGQYWDIMPPPPAPGTSMKLLHFVLVEAAGIETLVPVMTDTLNPEPFMIYQGLFWKQRDDLTEQDRKAGR